MCTRNANLDSKSETLECLGPIALKAVALMAGLAIFAPLVAAFAAPFIG